MTKPRRAFRLRVGLLVAAAGLALAGCGGTHPGQAVVVDDTSYSMDRLDELSASFCVAALASQQSQQQGPGSEQDIAGGMARQEAAKTLVQLAVSQEVAENMGISVPASEYALNEAQLTQVREQVGESDAAAIREVSEMLRHTASLYQAIGTKEQGAASDSGNPQKIAAAGEKVVQQAIKDADISLDPRIGLDEATVAEDVGSGSMSVGVSSFADAKVSEAAASQRCN